MHPLLEMLYDLIVHIQYLCICKSIAVSALHDIKHEACGRDVNKARGEAEGFIWGVRHAFKLAEISFQTQNSFQNTDSVSKTQNQFLKHKLVFKIQITTWICKISFQIINIFNYKSVKLHFLSVMSSVFSAPPKFNICRHICNKAPSTFLFYMVHHVIISETIVLA